MNKLFIILKAKIFNYFGINKIFKDPKGNKKSYIAITFILIAILLSFVFYVFYMYFFGKTFSDNGIPEGILLLGISFSMIPIAISALLRTNGQLFESKDYELLLSLPINNKTIIKSNILSLLISSYSMALYFYVPSVIIYSVFNSVGFSYYILAVLGFFILPLPFIAIFGTASTIFGKIKIDQKIKRIIDIVINIIFIIAIIFLSSLISQSGENDKEFCEGMFNSLKNTNIFAYNMFLGIKGDISKFIICLVISVILFLGFVFYITKNFFKIYNNRKGIIIKSSKETKEEKATSILKSIVKKEFRNYISMPTYVVNTIIGPVLSTIIVIVMCREITADYIKMGETYLLTSEVLPMILLFSIITSVSLNSTSPSVTISLEGKNIWILKTLPLKAKTLFNGKILINMSISIPFIIIDSVIIMLLTNISILNLLFILLIPAVCIIYISNICIYINLLFPKLDFDNPVRVIKQSTSVLLGIVVSMVSVIIIALIAIALYMNHYSLFNIYLTILTYFVFLLTIARYLLIVKGEKLYKKLS